MLLVTFLFFQDLSSPLFSMDWGMGYEGGGEGVGGINSNGQLTIDTYFFLYIKRFRLTFIIGTSGILDFNAFNFNYPYSGFGIKKILRKKRWIIVITVVYKQNAI